jgi:hypothetical protein
MLEQREGGCSPSAGVADVVPRQVAIGARAEPDKPIIRLVNFALINSQDNVANAQGHLPHCSEGSRTSYSLGMCMLEALLRFNLLGWTRVGGPAYCCCAVESLFRDKFPG